MISHRYFCLWVISIPSDMRARAHGLSTSACVFAILANDSIFEKNPSLPSKSQNPIENYCIIWNQYFTRGWQSRPCHFVWPKNQARRGNKTPGFALDGFCPSGLQVVTSNSATSVYGRCVPLSQTPVLFRLSESRFWQRWCGSDNSCRRPLKNQN